MQVFTGVDSGKRRRLDMAGVAEAAVDAKIRNMVFMAEREPAVHA